MRCPRCPGRLRPFGRGRTRTVRGRGAESALTTIRRSFDRTKTAIDQIDPTNADEVATTLPTVFATVAQVANIQGSTPHLQNNPALKAAAAQAPNCQTLKRSG